MQMVLILIKNKKIKTMKIIQWISISIGFLLLALGMFLIYFEYSEGGFFLEKFLESNKDIRIPLIAVGAALLTLSAFLVQVRANQRIQDQFKVQQFESQFYKMLDLHIKNVEGFSINTYVEKDNFSVKDGIGFKKGGQLTGKRLFVALVTEYHFILDVLHKKFDSSDDKIIDSINKTAYQIFFFGISSNHIRPPKVDLATFNSYVAKLEKFQKGFRDTKSKNRSFSESGPSLELKTRFVPFSGHETRLAHYYRHLYQTVKQVFLAEQKGYISHNDARKYLSTLRAQLSNEEQQLLYYNYITGFGGNWDFLGGRHKFLTDYRMIHNIPLDDDRIHSKIVAPRNHFENYIKANAKKLMIDPLFEWGDVKIAEDTSKE